MGKDSKSSFNECIETKVLKSNCGEAEKVQMNVVGEGWPLFLWERETKHARREGQDRRRK